MRILGAAAMTALLALAALRVNADEGQCAYEDLMPEFFELKARTATLGVKARARQFAEEFAPRHREYYAPEVFGDLSELRVHAVRLFDSSKWPKIPGDPPLTEERMHETGTAVAGLFARAQERFMAEFPDFRCDTFVAFGPSLFSFDGRTYRGADGRARLLFGTDMIALLHTTDDMPAFFHHELFHLYQSQVLMPNEPPEELVWWALWNEGLATYVSHELNPQLSAAQVFWFPRDLDVQVESNLAHWAALLLDDLDKTGGDAYQRWFTAGDPDDGPPPRSGYYLGYLLAQELARGRSLMDVARLPPEEVRRSAQRFLERRSVSARMQPSREE